MLVTAAMKIDPADPKRLLPDNKLSVVDLKGDPPAITELEAGPGAAGVSITRDGKLALVANRNDGTVSVFGIQGAAVRKIGMIAVATPEAGVAHVAIAPDGRSALVMRDGDHTISVLAIDGDKVSYTGRDFGTGLKPYAAVITPDGRFAVVTNLGLGRGDNDTVSLVDLSLQPPRVVETYTVGQTPEGIAISPDGRLVAVVTMNGSNKPADSPFHSPAGRVVLLRVLRDRLQIVSSAPIGAWPQGAAFSSDGTTLLVQSMSERNLMVFAVDNASVLRDTGQRIALRGGGAALRTADRPSKQ
jgi:DNA-binding beta-propeller fold protein YncE